MNLSNHLLINPFQLLQHIERLLHINRYLRVCFVHLSLVINTNFKGKLVLVFFNKCMEESKKKKVFILSAGNRLYNPERIWAFIFWRPDMNTDHTERGDM